MSVDVTKTIEELDNGNPAAITRWVEAAERPAIVRGIAADWPAVAAARAGDEAIAAYLSARDNGNPLTVLVGPPETGGRYFYSDDMRGVNFRSEKMPMATLVAQLRSEEHTSELQSLMRI